MTPMLLIRGSLVGIASGALLLAGVVGFAVGLPEITDEPAAHEETTETDSEAAVEHLPVDQVLPDSLAEGALVKPDSVNPEASQAGDAEIASGQTMTELFGTDVAVGIYIAPGTNVQVSLAVADRAPGIFAPFGPPIPSEYSQGNGVIFKQRVVGTAVCYELYAEEGYTEQTPPAQLQCQTGDDTRTYLVYATGGLLASETVVEILDEVVAADKA